MPVLGVCCKDVAKHLICMISGSLEMFIVCCGRIKTREDNQQSLKAFQCQVQDLRLLGVADKRSGLGMRRFAIVGWRE